MTSLRCSIKTNQNVVFCAKAKLYCGDVVEWNSSDRVSGRRDCGAWCPVHRSSDFVLCFAFHTSIAICQDFATVTFN